MINQYVWCKCTNALTHMCILSGPSLHVLKQFNVCACISVVLCVERGRGRGRERERSPHKCIDLCFYVYIIIIFIHIYICVCVCVRRCLFIIIIVVLIMSHFYNPQHSSTETFKSSMGKPFLTLSHASSREFQVWQMDLQRKLPLTTDHQARQQGAVARQPTQVCGKSWSQVSSVGPYALLFRPIRTQTFENNNGISFAIKAKLARHDLAFSQAAANRKREKGLEPKNETSYANTSKKEFHSVQNYSIRKQQQSHHFGEASYDHNLQKPACMSHPRPMVEGCSQLHSHHFGEALYDNHLQKPGCISHPHAKVEFCIVLQCTVRKQRQGHHFGAARYKNGLQKPFEKSFQEP